MFSLLRKVRLSLLEQKSFGRYALYAVGEVLLIVIGILAALWIDTWNQERQEMKREQFYLSGLKAEFQVSLAKLDTLIAVNRGSYRTAEELLRRIPEAESAEQEAEISRMLIQALSYELAYNPNNSLLGELISSGRLETLSDSRLRHHLTSWASFVESVHRQERNLRSERERTTELLRTGEGSVRSILVYSGEMSLEPGRGGRAGLHSNLPLLKSRAFENNLLLFLLTARDTETVHYAPLRDEIETILGLIDSGLD